MSVSQKRSGYVVIAGKPNAGKSTLMNAIIGEKLSIVTPKPQTTRKKVLGIYTSGSIQAVFLDTPGILTPKYELQRHMMEYVAESLEEASLLTFIVDVADFNCFENKAVRKFLDILKNSRKPSILLLNKVDAIPDKKILLPIIGKFNSENLFSEIIPISATNKTGLDVYLQKLESMLPEQDFFYGEDDLSTQSERFFVSEIIREHIFNIFEEEVPYSCEVHITEFKERTKGKWYISADIVVERSSQKAIIIGKKGERIKEIGEKSRYDIEKHLNQPVFVDLFVKVREKWRENKNMLKEFGY